MVVNFGEFTFGTPANKFLLLLFETLKLFDKIEFKLYRYPACKFECNILLLAFLFGQGAARACGKGTVALRELPLLPASVAASARPDPLRAPAGRNAQPVGGRTLVPDDLLRSAAPRDSERSLLPLSLFRGGVCGP